MPCLPSSKVYPPDVGSFKTKFMDEASIEYYPEGESKYSIFATSLGRNDSISR